MRKSKKVHRWRYNAGEAMAIKALAGLKGKKFLIREKDLEWEVVGWAQSNPFGPLDSIGIDLGIYLRIDFSGKIGAFLHEANLLGKITYLPLQVKFKQSGQNGGGNGYDPQNGRKQRRRRTPEKTFLCHILRFPGVPLVMAEECAGDFYNKGESIAVLREQILQLICGWAGFVADSLERALSERSGSFANNGQKH